MPQHVATKKENQGKASRTSCGLSGAAAPELQAAADAAPSQDDMWTDLTVAAEGTEQSAKAEKLARSATKDALSDVGSDLESDEDEPAGSGARQNKPK